MSINTGWLTGTARRWFALVTGALTVIAGIGFAATAHRYWAWITIGALGLLVVALAWNARDVHRAAAQSRPDLHGFLRIQLEATAARLDHLGISDQRQNPKWFWDQYVEKSNAACCLIDEALGPFCAMFRF